PIGEERWLDQSYSMAYFLESAFYSRRSLSRLSHQPPPLHLMSRWGTSSPAAETGNWRSAPTRLPWTTCPISPSPTFDAASRNSHVGNSHSRLPITARPSNYFRIALRHMRIADMSSVCNRTQSMPCRTGSLPLL